MPAYPALLLIVLWVLAILALILVTRNILTLRRGNERLSRLAGTPEKDALDFDEDEPGFFRNWLYLAGFRSKDAPVIFLLIAMAFSVAGLALGWTFMNGSGQGGRSLMTVLMRAVSDYPGGLGEIFLPILLILPLAIWVTVSMVPWMVVRSARRRRLAMIREDLPVILELLATLSEAGLNFDASIERVLRSHRRSRPLAVEFRTYQADVLSGRSRIDCMRRMARRVDDLFVSTFASALAQAEQLGASVTTVLRRQADELRQRRREKALEMVLTLPVRRVIPMILCFIPGLMIVALGPIFYQLFTIMDQLIGNRGSLF